MAKEPMNGDQVGRLRCPRLRRARPCFSLRGDFFAHVWEYFLGAVREVLSHLFGSCRIAVVTSACAIQFGSGFHCCDFWVDCDRRIWALQQMALGG